MDHGILKTSVSGGEPYPFKQGPAVQLAPGSAGQLHHIQPPGAGVARFCVLLHRTAGVGFVAILPAALHDIRPGTRLCRQQRLHCVRQQAVIAIHKQDPAAHRPGQTGVAGAGRAAAVGGNKALGRGRLRVRKDLLDLSLFHDHTAVQNGHMVADLFDHAHLVGDDHHRDAQLPVDVLDERQDRVGGVGVQRAGGLIAEQHFGVGCQCAGNGNALFLAAGKHVGVNIRLIGQANALQQLHGLLVGSSLAHTAQAHRSQRDVLFHRQVGEQVKMLEHHAHLGAGGINVAFGDLFAVQHNRAAVRFFQAGQAAQKSGLAAAGRPNQADNIALIDGQVNALEHIQTVIVLF